MVSDSLAMLAQAMRPSPDGGPIYRETNLDRWIAEPWNAGSCLLFILLTIFWIVRLRGQYRRHAFLAALLPVVGLSAVGGTVYHAFRAHWVWLLMDWVPIVVLGLAVSVYFWSRVIRRWWRALLVVPAVFALQRLNFLVFGRWMAINVSYSLLALVILIPAALVVFRTRRRRAGWLLAAVGCFVLAIVARAADQRSGDLLPMGTHWLWHVFGACAAFAVAEYLYRLRADELASAPAAGSAVRAPAPAF